MQVLSACQNLLLCNDLKNSIWKENVLRRLLYPKIPNVHYNMVFLDSLFFLFSFCLSEQKQHLSCFWPESKWWFFSFCFWALLWFCSFNQISVSASSGYTWTQFSTLIPSIISKVLLEWVFEGVSVHILLCSLSPGNATSDLAISSSNLHPEIPCARKWAVLLTVLFLCVYVCVCSSESQTWASW